MTTNRPYHHGDLHRTLLAAAVELIAERGPAAVSLRDLARRAGVSHAAPAHHFGDKAGLFTAIAVQGHELLQEALAGGAELAELGVRYVRFAAEYRSHFEVMFRPDLCHRDDEELNAAGAKTGALLRAAVPPGPDAGRVLLAAWSIAHGFATLHGSGGLDALLAGADPFEAFREAALLLTIGG